MSSRQKDPSLTSAELLRHGTVLPLLDVLHEERARPVLRARVEVRQLAP